MTELGTTVASALAAAIVAGGGVVGGLANGWSGSSEHTPRTALVMDAGLGRDGRELVAPRLRGLDAELRLPRTEAEAETDLRYLAAQGYRLIVAGPDARAAAAATGAQAASLRR
jgi:hypothetical protein